MRKISPILDSKSVINFEGRKNKTEYAQSNFDFDADYQDKYIRTKNKSSHKLFYYTLGALASATTLTILAKKGKFGAKIQKVAKELFSFQPKNNVTEKQAANIESSTVNAKKTDEIIKDTSNEIKNSTSSEKVARETFSKEKTAEEINEISEPATTPIAKNIEKAPNKPQEITATGSQAPGEESIDDIIVTHPDFAFPTELPEKSQFVYTNNERISKTGKKIIDEFCNGIKIKTTVYDDSNTLLHWIDFDRETGKIKRAVDCFSELENLAKSVRRYKNGKLHTKVEYADIQNLDNIKSVKELPFEGNYRITEYSNGLKTKDTVVIHNPQIGNLVSAITEYGPVQKRIDEGKVFFEQLPIEKHEYTVSPKAKGVLKKPDVIESITTYHYHKDENGAVIGNNSHSHIVEIEDKTLRRLSKSDLCKDRILASNLLGTGIKAEKPFAFLNVKVV